MSAQESPAPIRVSRGASGGSGALSARETDPRAANGPVGKDLPLVPAQTGDRLGHWVAGAHRRRVGDHRPSFVAPEPRGALGYLRQRDEPRATGMARAPFRGSILLSAAPDP